MCRPRPQWNVMRAGSPARTGERAKGKSYGSVPTFGIPSMTSAAILAMRCLLRDRKYLGFLPNSGCFLGFEIIQKRHGRFPVCRVHGNPSRNINRGSGVRRQSTDKVESRMRIAVIAEIRTQGDLTLAIGDRLLRAAATGEQLDLGLHLIGDAHLV